MGRRRVNGIVFVVKVVTLLLLMVVVVGGPAWGNLVIFDSMI